MSVFFKPLYEDTTDQRLFGICDDKKHQRAYIHLGPGHTWSAVIVNNSRLNVTFTALDNCIEIRKPNNKMESRCEGALTYNDTIILIEIRERTGGVGGWAKKADDQLRASIAILSSKINSNAFSNKRAAIANKLRTRSKEKHTARIKKFLNDTGYILTVDYRIIID